MGCTVYIGRVAGTVEGAAVVPEAEGATVGAADGFAGNAEICKGFEQFDTLPPLPPDSRATCLKLDTGTKSVGRRTQLSLLRAVHGAEHQHNARTLADEGTQIGRAGRDPVAQNGVIRAFLRVSKNRSDLPRG